MGVSGNGAVGYCSKNYGVTTFLCVLIILHVTAAAAVPSPSFLLWTTTLLLDSSVVAAATATTASFVFRHMTAGHDHPNKHDTHHPTLVDYRQARSVGKACRWTHNIATRIRMGVVPPCSGSDNDDPHGRCRRREERRRSVVVLQVHRNDQVDHDNNGENDDEIESIMQQPPYYYLSVAATHLKEASMALSLLDNHENDGNDLLDASKDLERASMAWQDEEDGGWEAVAMELGSCSASLVQQRSNHHETCLYARASEALWEASQIGGCLSVGPMASASFMEDFAAELETLSTNNGPSAKQYQAAASAIQAYVHSCIG